MNRLHPQLVVGDRVVLDVHKPEEEAESGAHAHGAREDQRDLRKTSIVATGRDDLMTMIMTSNEHARAVGVCAGQDLDHERGTVVDRKLARRQYE